MKPEMAQKILDKNKQDWGEIAEKFSGTRQYIWPELTSLIKPARFVSSVRFDSRRESGGQRESGGYIKDGDTVLDLGCGNGRLYELFKNRQVSYTGVDQGKKLIEIARKQFNNLTIKQFNNPQFIVADALNLDTECPRWIDKFDVILAIAVFHHIPSKELRIQFLKNCHNLLKPNGFLILTVWNLWQPRLLVKYKIWPMIFGRRIKGLDFKDVFIPFQLPNRDIKRYYHTFTRFELKRLVKKVGFNVINNYFARGNIIVIAQK